LGGGILAVEVRCRSLAHSAGGGALLS